MAHAGELCVRSWKGPRAEWLRATQVERKGRISGTGFEADVAFAPADDTVQDVLDAAYRSRYRDHGAEYVNAMVAPAIRPATVRPAPREREQAVVTT